MDLKKQIVNTPIDIRDKMSQLDQTNKTKETLMNNNQLQSIVDRIEALDDEKKMITQSINDIYTEAKSNGYDVKVLRKVVAMRKKSTAQRQEEEALMEIYMNALGMLSDTPLGQSALDREFKK